MEAALCILVTGGLHVSMAYWKHSDRRSHTLTFHTHLSFFRGARQ